MKEDKKLEIAQRAHEALRKEFERDYDYNPDYYNETPEGGFIGFTREGYWPEHFRINFQVEEVRKRKE